jgi:CheY-like chemotaxis protein
MYSTLDTRNEATARSGFSGSATKKEKALRIMVVDDQKVNREIVISILTSMGYDLEVAENGREAVNKWENDSFDLILMDIHMPLIDGFEATWIIRNQERDRGDYTPIIACSADYVKECSEELSGLGFDGFIRKPLVLETLLLEIRRCVLFKRPCRFDWSHGSPEQF